MLLLLLLADGVLVDFGTDLFKDSHITDKKNQMSPAKNLASLAKFNNKSLWPHKKKHF